MATRTQNCPNCGSSMNIQHFGAMQDKVWVCPSCGTTVDAPDHYQRIHRRQHIGPQGEHVYEEIHEIRSDDPSVAPLQQRVMQVQTPIMAPPIATGQSIKVDRQAGACLCGFTGTMLLATVVVPLLIAGVAIAAVLLAVEDSPFSAPLESLGIVSSSPKELSVLREAVFENSNVDSLIYSPTGQRLITLGSPDEIVLWDTSTYQPVTSIDARFHVAEVSFTADGSRFGYADGGDIVIHDSTTGAIVRSGRITDHYYNHFLFSPNGEDAVVVESDVLKVVGLATFVPIRELGEAKSINMMFFSSNGRYLFIITHDSQVSIWNMNASTLLYKSKVPDMSNISAAAFSPDNQTLALATSSTIQLYTLVGSDLRKSKTFEVTGGVYSVRGLDFSPDAQYLASGDFFGKALVWDISKGKAVYTSEHDDVSFYRVAFSPDGHVLVGSGYGDFLVFWQFSDEPIAHTAVAPPIQPSRTPTTAPANNPMSSPTSLNNSLGSQINVTCIVTPKTTGVRIRAEASTDAAVQGTLSSQAFADGQKKTSDGRTWWHLADGSGWVRDDVVEAPAVLCSELPTIE